MRTCSVNNCEKVVWGTDRITRLGYCRSHQYQRTDLSRKTIMQRAIEKQKGIKSKVKSLEELPENKKLMDDKKEMDEWFKDRAKELTGFCKHCGGKTTKGNLKYERYSICHILEKKNFKSVKTHPLNFIELCYFNNSCHSQMDNKMIEMQDMKCWEEIQSKFEKMYPLISKDEYRFIPDVLIESL